MNFDYKKQPLVSIVIPAYNSTAFIKETLENVFNQTYKNLEIIIVDDGSTDDLKKFLADLIKTQRIIYVYQKNAGQSAARNTGHKIAKGKYIAFLDSDDLYLPVKIEEQVKYLENHPECDVCYCDILHFLDTKPRQFLHHRYRYPSGQIFDKLLKINYINPLSALIKKEVLDKYGAFRPDFRRSDEWYLWLNLAFHNVKFFYLDKILGHYRVRPGNLSSQATYFQETADTNIKLFTELKNKMSLQDQKRYDLNKIIQENYLKLTAGYLMLRNKKLALSTLRYLLKNGNLNLRILAAIWGFLIMILPITFLSKFFIYLRQRKVNALFKPINN